MSDCKQWKSRHHARCWGALPSLNSECKLIFYIAYHNQHGIQPIIHLQIFSLTAKVKCSFPPRWLSLPSRLPHSLRCAMKFFNFCSLCRNSISRRSADTRSQNFTGLRETPSLAAVFTVCSHAAAASRPQSSVNHWREQRVSRPRRSAGGEKTEGATCRRSKDVRTNTSRARRGSQLPRQSLQNGRIEGER